MKSVTLSRLLFLTAALFLFITSFSQAVYIDSTGPTPKYKRTKQPGGRMTDFQGAMDYEFNMIKNPATGKVPEGSFTQEKEQAKTIPSTPARNNISNVGTPYAFQGPNNLGGRTRAIAYDVRFNGTSNRIILAGGVSGGVYKSTDDGATWVRKSPTGEHFSCTSIAQDTRPGFQDTWYYGVGESSGNSASFSGATYFGNGVYKSTDNGETWTRLTASNTSALESFSTGADAIQKVIVDPTDGYVYVACLAKIMRSTDGGTTWVDVLPGVLASSSQTTDIVVSSTGRLYASFGGTNDSGVDGVWASAPGPTSGDPGSWTRIAGAGAGGSPTGWNFEAPAGTPGGYGRVVLHIPPADETKLYALYWNNVTYTCGAPSPEAELFRWDDVGATWTNLSATLPDEAGCLAGNDPFAVQGGYDLVIASKPDAAGTIFIGGTNAYRSTDAGLTWTRIGGYASAATYALYASSHPDIHAFVFQPGSPSIMLCGNDGGIQRTTDNLAATVVWSQINIGYRTFQYYHVAVDPRVGNTKVIGGTQDNGTARNVGGVGTTHEGVFGGDGVSVGLSDLIGGIQYEYVGFQNGEIFRRDATLGAGFGDYIIPPGESGTGLFVTLFKLDVDNSQILYYANDNKIYRTTSASTVTSGTWTDMTGIGTAVGASNDITAIATTRGTYSPATASLFLGTSNGKIYRLNDPAGVAAGTGPVDITGAGFPASGYVSSIAVNPRNDDTLVVTFSNYGVTSVFWTGSANSATPTWTPVEGALTLPSYRSSAIAVTASGVEYFVGTSTGLYTSMGLPGAVSWTKEGATEMGNAVISSLALRASDNKLLVGTHGYGMWETTLTTGAVCSITLTSAAGTNTQTVCISTPITTITYATTDATGATFSGLPAGVTGSWAANVVTISGTPSASGTFPYTVTLTGGSCVGVTATGTITVTPNNTVTLTSAVGTDAQTVCIGTAITNITYATTGATGATFSGLPAGVTGSWAANVATISGTPSASGIFPYTVTLTGGCGTITATGSITVTANNTVTLTSAVGTNAQTITLGSPITTITYATTGATGATFSGLPAGVTGSWAANVVTISGTPSAAGVYSYTVSLTGGCGTVTATGTITVNPPTLETWELSAAAGSQASSAPATTAVNISAGTLTRGAGVTASAGGGSMNSSGWFNSAAATTLTDAITNNEYYEFTLPVNAGFTADITAVAFYLRSSSTGPNTATLRSSADGYTTDLGTATAIPNAAASLYTLPVTLTGISGTLTFRLYGWGGASGGGTPSTGGTMRIGTSPTALADDLDIFGTTAAASICSATLTSAAGTNAQTVCISTLIVPITYSTVGATGATFSGLPAGVTGSWAANVITISGTPTASGVFPYTVTLTGGPCTVETVTGSISVTANNTVTLTSAVGTNAQTVCISTPITTITYATTGATGATFSGLPAGVTGSWAANVATISGTPSASGVFPYTVTLTGGCGTITATGSITVTANNTVTLTSAVGTNAQTVCISTPITTITYATTGATGATFSGLPAGVTGSWAANVATISGTPSASGVFPYTVTLTGGCGTITATGSITVTVNNTVTLTSAVGTNAQTVCISTPITTITYATTGATGATFSGLPAGITGSWAANVASISGTPSASGVFPYTVTLTGGCGTITATGTITVTANNTVTLTSAVGTNAQTITLGSPITTITYATTGATGASFSGLPGGVTGSWAANVVTISGTPAATGVFSYTVTLTGGCGTITATGTITVNSPAPANDNCSAAIPIACGGTASGNTTTATIDGPATNCGGGSVARDVWYSIVGTGGTITASLCGGGTTYDSQLDVYTGSCGALTNIGGCNDDFCGLQSEMSWASTSGTTYLIRVHGFAGNFGPYTLNITCVFPCTITLSSAPGTNTQTVCQNTPITNITYATTVATGATFSGLPAGVTGSWAANVATISGTPTVAGVFNYTVTLVGCSSPTTATGTITVTAVNAATISYSGTPYCTTVTNAPVTRTGTAGGTYSAAPAGLTIDAATGTVNPSTSTPSPLPYTVTYTMAATGGCPAATATTTITITAAPNMIILYPNNPYCSNAGTAPVSLFGTPGGTYSAPPGLSINAITGAVNLGASTPGTYTVTYAVTNPACGTTITTAPITINQAPNATISYGPLPYCSNAGTANVTITGGPTTGTFSSTAGLSINTTTGAVNLGASTAGTYTVTYTVATGGGCATYTTTTTITITQAPNTNTTIAYTGSPYCSNAGTATVTINGTTGGTFSAPAGLSINAATGAVNLATSTAGSYTVTYTIAAGGGCPAVTATAGITITTVPAATISYAGNPFCQPGGIVAVTLSGTAGGTYSAVPAGLNIIAATGDINVTTSTPGTYTVSYTLAAGGGCPVQTATTSVTINSLSAAPTGATATATSLCTPGTVTLSVVGGSLGSGSTWRWYSGSCGGTLVGNGATLNVTVNTTTTYFVRAEGPCGNTTCASVTVTVNVQPTISIAAAPRTILVPMLTTTLTATVSPAGTPVQWFKNGNAIPGATNLTYVVTIDGISSNYTARATTAAGCTALSNAIPIDYGITSKMSINPNPTLKNGFFNIRIYNTFGRQLIVRVLHTGSGQEVLWQRVKTSQPYELITVDLRGRATGYYVVELRDDLGNILNTRQVLVNPY